MPGKRGIVIARLEGRVAIPSHGTFSFRSFEALLSSPIYLQALVDFVAGEVEKDIWQQLASELGKDMGHVIGGRRSSADKRSEGRGGGGDASFRVFIADLSRVADSREVRRRPTH